MSRTSMSGSSRSGGTRSGGSRAKRGPQFGPLQYTIIVLTAITALVHFVIAFDYTFILNGLGYLVLLGALYLPLPQLDPYRHYARWALMLYAAVTVILWAVITGGSFSWVAYITKAVEIGLIVALWFEGQQQRARSN